MYEWHSLDHVPLASSYAVGRARRARPNRSTTSTSTRSTSSRTATCWSTRATRGPPTTSTRSTGQVRWQLGGKHSSFKLGPGTRTAWQHDARQQPDGAITFFDNGASPEVHPQSRAIELALDPATHDGDARAPLRAPEPARRRQPGQRAGARRRRLDGRLGPGRLPLGGRPRRPGALQRPPAAGLGVLPDLSRCPGAGSRPNRRRLARRAAPAPAAASTVYASWNGATEVASWRVLAGASPKRARAGAQRARRRASRPRSRCRAGAAGSYVAVQALDAPARRRPAASSRGGCGRRASRVERPRRAAAAPSERSAGSSPVRRPAFAFGAAFAPRGGAPRRRVRAVEK